MTYPGKRSSKLRPDKSDRGRKGSKGWCERFPVELNNCPKTKSLTREPRPSRSLTLHFSEKRSWHNTFKVLHKEDSS